MPSTLISVEIAVDSINDALLAAEAGATRLELCSSLSEGGLTPSAGLIAATLRRVDLPVFVIVRPRSGDFLYSASEIDVMLRDVETARAAGAHGIVSGALNANGTVDEDGVRALLDAANPLPFTFHRAIDFARDVDESVDRLAALGVHRVLTSGGAVSASEGTAAITRMVERLGKHLVVIAGGGVRASNVDQMLRLTGVSEVHLGPRRTCESAMRHRTSAGGPRLSRGADADQFSWSVLDDAEVRRTVDTVRAFGRSR